jgi:hypothetical protein
VEILVVLGFAFRARSVLWGLLALASALSVARGAVAEERIDKLSNELSNNTDFRVRTQAALALGASKDKRAVTPLCGGLDDSNTTVRAAAAAALGKLALGGLACLKSHRDGESSDSVKSVIATAIDKVAAAGRPVVTTETKYYVAIGPTTDKTGRNGTEIDDMVHAAMADACSSLEGSVVAPRDEKTSEASAIVAKFKKLKAFFLWPKVMAPDYSGSKLTLRVELSVFTYPGKALKGTIPLKLTMPDVTSVDKSSENDLIGRAASSAIERFAENVDRFQ